MAKKWLIGAALTGFAVLAIALLVPAVMAETNNGTYNPMGEKRGQGPRDDDNDGIPNGQDPDYVRDENCTGDGPHGENGEHGHNAQGQGNGSSNGPHDGTGNQHRRGNHGNGNGSGNGERRRDGSCME